MTVLHIVAGLIGIASGAVALWALKGAALHRRSGRIFVYSMLVMSALGAWMALLNSERLNVIAGLLTFYLVATGLLTLRRRVRWLDAAAMLGALAIAIVGFMSGPSAFFGAVALLAVFGDVRMMRAGGIYGPRRLARHLWRMCFALFVATGSFFLGQADVFPEPIRITPLLAAPVLLVLVLMFYWLARVLFTPRHRRVVRIASIQESGLR